MADQAHSEASPSDPGLGGQITVSCPGCDAQLLVDIASGTVLWHRMTPAPPPTSLDDLLKHRDSRRKEVAEQFERERRGLSDRGRVLEEKVKESLKHVDPNAPPPLRPIDLD